MKTKKTITQMETLSSDVHERELEESWRGNLRDVPAKAHYSFSLHLRRKQNKNIKV